MVTGIELSLSSAAGVTLVTVLGSLLLLNLLMGIPFFAPRWTCKGKVSMAGEMQGALRSSTDPALVIDCSTFSSPAGHRVWAWHWHSLLLRKGPM